MASSSSRDAKVEALMECSICFFTFRKPKCLPCVHTFCLDCLQEYVDKKNFVDTLPCPLCRESIAIPAQGLVGLRDNFFVQSLIELEGKVGLEIENSENIEVKCDLCADGFSYAMTEMYCPECDKFICTTCARAHAKIKLTESHSVVSLKESDASYIRALLLNRPRFCHKHKTDTLRLYCDTCKLAVCMVCYALDHNGHQCEEIKDTATKFRNEFGKNVADLKGVVQEFKDLIHKLNLEEENARKESQENKFEIRRRISEFRRKLDLYEVLLTNESEKLEEGIVKEISSEASEVEFQSTLMENFTAYVEKITEAGSHCDVAFSGNELVQRAKQLLDKSRALLSRERPDVRHCKFIQSSAEAFAKEDIGHIVAGARSMLILGLDTGPSVQQKICQVNLDQRDTVKVIHSTPAEIGMESAACVVSNVLYAVGIGRARNQLWAWSASRDEWTRCADMTSGRRRHCVTSVGDKIYVLGGWVDAEKKTLDSILCYDINSNKWSEAGQLCHAVRCATCVTYKHYIYTFGGSDKNNKVTNYVQKYYSSTGTTSDNYVQKYDSSTDTTSLVSNPMPSEGCLFGVALWKSKAILVGRYTCYIYDFPLDRWEERQRFKTDMLHFGLTLGGTTLYISGGGTCSADVWMCRNDVRSLAVDDFLTDNKLAKWEYHASLPTPSAVHAYSSVSLFLPNQQ